VLNRIVTKTNSNTEAYGLTVNRSTVEIDAGTSVGLFYGAQTLLQLLPPEIFATNLVHQVAWSVPAVRIEDEPRFPWRGWMLDVSRHFFDKAEIKRTLDLMAMHKLNVFHWHLVDDQGWRIEIKKYPKLTEVGAWRKSIGFDLDPAESTAYGSDGRYGGFYTQADVREIVAYAQNLHITIVPEIEMPGHSVAALAAYPELSCTGGPFDLDIGAGIFDGIFCAGNEQSFTFLEDVLTEVFDLFPGKYIHIGGDEVTKGNWQKCPKCQARMKQEGLKNEHELQSYFVSRMEKFINAHGRSLVGWSEIREGGLAPSATIMDWNGGAVESASAGHDVIMATKEFGYLCYYPSLDRLPYERAYRPYLPLSKVYAFEPVPTNLPPQYIPHIIGAEACLWTVYFGSEKEIDEMSFPRLSAWSEIAWSPKTARDWNDFERRLPVHTKRLSEMGVNYWRDSAAQIGEWKPAQISAQGGTLEWTVPVNALAPGKCRLSLDYVRGRDSMKIQWVALLEDGREIVRDEHDGFTANSKSKTPKAHDWNYFLNVPEIKKGANYTVRAHVSGDGGTDTYGVAFLDARPLN
jgi:hexosaminidase